MEGLVVGEGVLLDGEGGAAAVIGVMIARDEVGRRI
jgi:hypothetical protein